MKIATVLIAGIFTSLPLQAEQIHTNINCHQTELVMEKNIAHSINIPVDGVGSKGSNYISMVSQHVGK
jgi:hypothetical protein